MDSAPNAAELIAQLADLQVRFVTLDPAALTTTDLASLREQLAIVEKQLCAFEHARPKRQPATPSTLRSLLTLARADLAAALGGDITPAEQLTQIIDLTVRLVPGTQHASVAVLHDNDRLETLASTSSIAVACDHAQRNGEGPCFALNIDNPMLRIDDLRHDTRWPGFAARAAELGIRSTLVCELPAIRRHTATLNVYCARRSAFRAAAELVAPVFASRAAIALAHTTQVANLHTAINSRQVIGEAVGILMERHRLTEDEAFQRLVTASQHQHIKLRDLATRITQTGEDPDTLHT
jgi:ANTAR domain